MPTKCTRPSWSAGSSTSGTGTFTARLLPPAASSTIRASRSSASRGISPSAAADIAPSRSGSVASAGTVAGAHSGVIATSCTSRAPPASTTGRALSSCSPLPIGNGTKTAGSPVAATSVTVLAPARQTTRSAAA